MSKSRAKGTQEPVFQCTTSNFALFFEAVMQLELILYIALVSLTLFNAPITVRAQGDSACMDNMGLKPDQQEKLRNLKKYYCISQCMGGFGGEVDFCRSDGICLDQPSAPSGFSSAANMPRT